MRLPSERFRSGDPRPIGFESELSPSLVSRTIAALEEIAAEVTMPAGLPALSVCLTSVALAPGLPFNLYGFALYEVDDEGHIVTAAPDQEIRYAIIANQPVGLQREAAISFFFQLLGRQMLVGRAIGDPDIFADLPAQTVAVDEERSTAASSEPRGNWREAIRSLQAQATDAGVSLQVRYQPDPFPVRGDVVRRYGTRWAWRAQSRRSRSVCFLK